MSDDVRVWLASAQGGFYLATGVWPLVSLRSFTAVTGPKVDGWLVQTLGLLIAVVGSVLLLAAWRGGVPLEVGALAAGSAAALGGADVYFVAVGRISRVYLLDAVAEAVLIAGWAGAWLAYA